MDTNNPGSVHYNRWNENNINIDVEGSQPTSTRWDMIMSYRRKITISDSGENISNFTKICLVIMGREIHYWQSWKASFFLLKNKVRLWKRRHLVLTTVLLHSQDLQQNVHWSDWSCSEVCCSFVCTGGHLHDWICDRILCPPMLIQVFCSFIINSTWKKKNTA